MAIVDNTSINMGEQIHFNIRISILLDIPRSEIAGSYDNFTFNFFEYFIMFSIAAAPFYIPTYSVQQFQFPTHQHLSFVILMIAILTDMRWYFIVVLICNLIMVSNVENLFIYIVHLYFLFLEECLLIYPSPCPICNWELCLFCYWVVWVSYILWILIHIRYMVSKLLLFSH